MKAISSFNLTLQEELVEENQGKLLFSNMFICNSFTWCVTEINGKNL